MPPIYHTSKLQRLDGRICRVDRYGEFNFARITYCGEHVDDNMLVRAPEDKPVTCLECLAGKTSR